MPPLVNELNHATLTRIVNKMKPARRFLFDLLYPTRTPVATDQIFFDIMSGDAEVAPFIKKNGEAVMVGGFDFSSRMVSPTNIRLKRPMQPHESLEGRKPGGVIFLDEGSGGDVIRREAQAHIGRELRFLDDRVANAEEYLSALSLTGVISYEDAAGDVFQITIPRDSGSNIVLGTPWDIGYQYPSQPDVHEDILAVQRQMQEMERLSPAIAICGSEAAAALRYLIARGMVVIDNANITQAKISLDEQYRDYGVLYIGRIRGVDFWEYSPKIGMAGAQVDLIRPKYIEFIAPSTVAERVMYYGPIFDWKALRSNRLQARRFAKSWETEDPSQLFYLLASRPLPVPRKVDANISVKVISG